MKSSSLVLEDHLSESTREFLESCNDDLEKRIWQLEGETWIGYPAAINIINRIENLIRMPRLTRMHSLLVYGPTDNGKTSILKRIEAKYQRTTTKEGKMFFPVASFQMPPSPDEIAFDNCIFRSIMQPILTGKVHHIRDTLRTTLREYEVRLLLIDEVQHIDRMPIRKQRAILDNIKYISNDLSLPIVAFGVEEAVNVFASDPQLNNRFKKINLPLWNLDEDFQRLLASIERLLPLKEPSGLSDQKLASYIFSKTNGTIGEINLILKTAAIAAIKSGQEKITREIIESLNFESSKIGMY
jgi:hypothetical protein